MLKKATRTQVKLKLGLFGVSGSGKTMSALRLAYGLCGDWDKIAVIDSEFISDQQTSSELYAGYKTRDFSIGEFNIFPLKPPYAPERYVNAIWECEQAGMEVIIIDSISHEWEGQGGCLEVAKKFNDWKDVGPAHTKFIEKIKQSSCHIIACGRVKTKYETFETVNRQGKDTIGVKKMGVGVVSREGFDYELITAFDIDQSHFATTSKDRTGLFSERTPFEINEATGQELLGWVATGNVFIPDEKEELKAKIIELIKTKGINKEDLPEITGVSTLEGQPVEVYRDVFEKLSA